jgi:hypothetical protein
MEMYGFRGLLETADPLTNFNNIIYTQIGSFLHKTTSEKVWLPQSDKDRGSSFRGLIETAESFMTPQKPSRKRILALSSFKGILWQK